MDLSALFKSAGKAAVQNSPAVLTALAVSGTITTAYFAARAAFKSAEVIGDHIINRKDEIGYDENDLCKERVFITNRDMFDLTWKLYIPAAGSAALTIAAIICVNRIGERRTATMATAYATAQKGFDEYRKKVTEKIGKTKEQAVRDDIAQDQVTKNPTSKSEIVLVSNGEVLLRDAYSGRYFTGNMEKLKKTVNDVNWAIINDGYSSLTDFWTEMGLASTSESDNLGWNTDTQFDVDISWAGSENDRPCLVYTFNPAPIPRFYRNSY